MTPQEIIAHFNRERGYFTEELLFIRKLRSLALNDEQIAAVCVVMDTTCMECLDRPAGCQCWNDE